MLTSAWPYLLRLALASYFFYNHLPQLLQGFNLLAANKHISSTSNSIFTCASAYISPDISFIVWHGAFVLLGVMIVIWPRPIFWIAIAIVYILINIYFSFVLEQFGVSTLLMIISLINAVVLAIIYGLRKSY